LSSTDRLDLTLQSSFDDLEQVVDVAETFFSSWSSDDEFVYKAVLLASEAVTNAIEHGNNLDETKSVKVVFLARPDAFEIHVEDEGEGFVRAQVADPLEEENILDDGGRGIFLIERLADEVRYENGGRRVIIRFLRPAS